MRSLIVEDDQSGMILLRKVLAEFGGVDDVPDGPEAVEAFERAWREGKPYDVIFLDIMMPNMSGHQVLKAVREKEREMRLPRIKEAKVIMTTALDDAESVSQAFHEGRASAYLVKPILRHNIIEEMRKLGLI